MRKILGTIALAGLAVFGQTAIAGASAPSPKLPTHWTASAEAAVLILVPTFPEFDGYSPACVLDQIEAEFSSPRNYNRTAVNHPESPRFTSIALDVIVKCEAGSTY